MRIKFSYTPFLFICLIIFFSSCNKAIEEPNEPTPEYELVKKRTFQQKITDISLDENGNPWFLSKSYGIAYSRITEYSENTWKQHGDSLFSEPEFSINCIELINGHMTIGTTNFGMFCYENNGWKSIDLDTNYFNPGTIYELAGDDNNIWIQYKDGFAKFNSNWELLYLNDTIPYVFSSNTMILDNNNNPWIGNGQKLYHFNENNIEQFDISQGIFSLHLAKNNIIWIGTSIGLTLAENLTLHHLSTSEMKLIDKFVYSIIEDNDENIWISTGGMMPYSGLTKYDGKDWKTYDLDRKVDEINNLLIDSENNFWITSKKTAYLFSEL